MASRLSAILNGIINPFGKKLWSGTWTTGNKTVTGSTNYCAFLITLDNNYSLIGLRDFARDRVNAIGGTFSGNALYTASVAFSCSGDTWTLTSDTNKQIHHNSSGNHGAVSSQTITGVYGLVPNWGGS